MKTDIIHSKDFVNEAVQFILEKAQESFQEKGSFLISLCGGKTPEPIYRALAKRGQLLDWKNIYITFGDERCVPTDNEESNYRMARLALFDSVPIPAENVFRIKGEIDPEIAAMDYEKSLMNKFGNSEGEVVHDLILLGMGDDGHTASLFPGMEVLNADSRLVVSNFVPKFGKSRITFTYKLINSAKDVCFLVNDPAKQNVLDKVLNRDKNLPASNIYATQSLTWFLGY